jgi:hypothetical protein
MLNNKALAASVSAAPAVYVEDVFSTWLYTGTGSTQTITNGIDLSGKGGLVWIKNRTGSYWHQAYDTARGSGLVLFPNDSSTQFTRSDGLTAFNTNGFSLGANANSNASSVDAVSWTFRKQAKFFDVVTYTGSLSNLVVNHNLGSTPGCIIIKQTNGSSNWFVYHRSTTDIYLNLTNAASGFSNECYSVTSNSFTVAYGSANTNLNASATYVAYLFAHNAGGFGTAGTDSVISCGTFNDSSAGTVNLGWEPQWILYRSTASGNNWTIFDNMRGWPASGNSQYLWANSANAESGTAGINTTSTGFSYPGYGAGDYVYIAIRRGPMKTPTSATSVFAADAQAGGSFVTTSFPVDLSLLKRRTNVETTYALSRMQGGTLYLETASTSAEQTPGASPVIRFDSNVGIEDDFFGSGSSLVYFNFRRAPGFFDVVAYTGTGSATTVSHNLGVVPELMLVKCRSVGTFWRWYWAPLGATKNFYMPNDEASVTQTEIWNNTSPTSTVFTVGTSTDTNFSARTYIAYLFASLTGISKVGSYTGTGTTLNIDCGFTAGARFVLIKRSDSTGDWYVWDTARGIVSGNDPFLLINSTAAENTSTDYIDPLSSGFQISSTAPAAINANGGTFVYLAIA